MGVLFDNIEGHRFGRLTAVRRESKKWLCKCDCGAEKLILPSNLKCGLTKSCGCFRRETSAERLKLVRVPRTTHGMSHSAEHDTWCEIHKRCYDGGHESFPYHAGRGIRVCDRWGAFESFYADMGDRPSDVHSIDRIDNDGDYEPGNCRWATRVEQALNTRRNLIITAFGRTAPLGEFVSAKESPVEYKRAWRRLRRGWSPERALTADNDPRGGAQCR